MSVQPVEAEVTLNPLVISERNIHGSSVTFVGVEHTTPEIFCPWKQLTKIINSKKKILLEYFPWELEKTVYSKGIIGNLARIEGDQLQINSFFGKVSKTAMEANKNVLVMDPANNLDFLFYTLFPIASSLPPTLMNLRPDKKITRRNFLGLSGLVSLSVASLYWSGALSFWRGDLTVDDMRETVVAQGLLQCPADLAVIYPQKHIEGILRHIDNPQLSTPSALVYELPVTSRLIREFRPEGTDWIQTGNTPIKL